jgi:hypothetical protein
MVPLLVLAGQVHAQQAADTSAFLIPRDQLATQDSDPFMLAGRVMDETRPRWAEFEDTLAAFPDSASCLLPEERGNNVQNLLAFDWKAMRYLTEIDICVWRIATTLDDIGLGSQLITRKCPLLPARRRRETGSGSSHSRLRFGASP